MKHSLKGFSILEFLISISIGTLLVAALGQIYLSNKSTFLIQEGLARLQENGRYVNHLLNHDLRMAGFQGCSNINQVSMNNLIQSVSTLMDYSIPMEGYDGLGSSFSPALPTNISSKSPLATSDIIELRMASDKSTQVSSDMSQTSSNISVYGLTGAQSGIPIMITNCAIGDIFMAGSGTNPTSITHPSGVNSSNSLTTVYKQGAQVTRLLYYAFYIKNSGRFNSLNQPIPVLVRMDINGNEDEIAEGVEQMRIVYGVDTDENNAADTFQTATQVNAANNWNNVISIQINLLFATIENVVEKAQSYRFNGSTFTPTDRKLRRQWNIFITLRNRGLPS